MGELWRADPARARASRMWRFLESTGFETYDHAWEWSIGAATAGEFWRRVAAAAEIGWHSDPVAVLETSGEGVAGAHWFPGGRLNYAERALRGPPGGRDAIAVMGRSDTRGDIDLSWGELRQLVSRVRAGLVAGGVGPGDYVAAYLPNIPEALAAMLAAASLGAVWTCCPSEMGVGGSLDRLSQTDPVVLIAADGYRYGERVIDRAAEAEAIRAGLPSLRQAIWLPYLDQAATPPPGWASWDRFTSEDRGLDFASLPFDHPLYVLFSSGTTGKPKAIVHGHGGILLEHAKALGLHFDLGAGDRFFWYSTTGWMMWNFCVSGLAVDAAVVLFDGDPGAGQGERLWQLMASTGTTCGGVGAGYLVAGMKARGRPGSTHDLSKLRTLGSTGSPLPAAAAEWVYRDVAADVLLASFSGGSDVCTGFVGTSPLHPVWAGEISCRCLGAAVEVYDDGGRSIVGSEGELVLTAPLPSMPVRFLGDADGSRYRSAYFERFPGVWAHGDRATLTERGTIIITGRSDGTLNRGGVRMGTADFYSVVEGLDAVADSLVVHLEDPGGGPGDLILFVVPAADSDAGSDPAALVGAIRAALRAQLSPRHVPDRVELVAAIPRTLSGKKLEVPVKRILSGAAPTEAVALESVADPASLEPFVEMGLRLQSVRR